jgi:restriction endonuclease S subunit
MRDGWVETKLGLVSEFIMGQAPLGERCNKDGIGTPFVKAGEFEENRPKIVEWTTDPLKMAKSSDVLVCVVGATAGKINLGADCAIGRSVAAIRPGKELHQFFLYYLLSLELSNLRSGSRGSAQGVITKDDLHRIAVTLPPLPEQKRIVDLISSVDSYIEALQQQLESAKRSRNAVLHELLITGGDDWVETTLGQISRCAGGCAFPDAFQGNKEGIPFIKVSDMNSQANEKYIETSNNFVTTEVVDDLRLRIWDKGTVIFPKVGAALLTEKRRILTTKTIFDNNIMGLVPYERVLSEFLYLLMLQIRFSDHVQPGAVPSIKNSIVEAITVLLPSLSEQNRIVTIVSELDGFIHFTETSINRTKALRSGLLSHLLSGEHEIPASYDKVIGAA